MPKGDVLILAGDITLLGLFDPNSQYFDRPKLLDRTRALLDECKANFSRVFYLIGNHEFYDSNISLAAKIIRKKLPGVTFLNDKAVDLGDNVTLVGGTLWTDMNAGEDCDRIRYAMNDFIVVHLDDENGTHSEGHIGTRRFQPEDAMKRFEKTKRLIARTAKKDQSRIIVIATHHAPSMQGINPIHVHKSHINHGYFTDLEAFIGGHPNIRYWVHGHTHLQKTYEVAQCRVMSNARGYIDQEASAQTFDPDCWFDPVTGKRKDPGGVSRKQKALAE